MLAPLHGLLSNAFGDALADSVVGLLQWVAFVAIVYLALGSLGWFGLALPEALVGEAGTADLARTLLVAIPLVLVSNQAVVEDD